MTLAFSVYLDLVRFFAAVAVFLDHLASKYFTSNLLNWRFQTLGGMAVVVFFVLSGFVIAYVTSTREKTLAIYAANRFARLYSVVLIALPLTAIIDVVAIQINPAYYATFPTISFDGYIRSALFLNEFQAFTLGNAIPGSNQPYWSLSFEASYYIGAGLILFCRQVVAVSACLVLCFFAGPSIVALAPIWALGFGLFHLRNRLILSRWVALSVFLTSVAGLLYLTGIQSKFITRVDTFFPWGFGGFPRILVFDYVVAIIFSIHLVAAFSIFSKASRPRFESWARWIGNLTFPLYCFHFPLIIFAASICPWGVDNWMRAVFVFAIVIIFVLIATPMTDKLKIFLRQRCEKLLGAWRQGRNAT